MNFSEDIFNNYEVYQKVVYALTKLLDNSISLCPVNISERVKISIH